MIGLWDTTGIEVVKALVGGAAQRRRRDQRSRADAGRGRRREDGSGRPRPRPRSPRRRTRAACSSSSGSDGSTATRSRLDAEIVVGGRLGPCEAVVLRMQGRLALHAESVVMPLLAPDVPVVTWWHGEPPERIAYDPLGVRRRTPDHRRRAGATTRSRRCGGGPRTTRPATPTWPGAGSRRGARWSRARSTRSSRRSCRPRSSRRSPIRPRR